MFTYKMRAESFHDVGHAIVALRTDGAHLGTLTAVATDTVTDDCEITFTATCNLAWLRRALKNVVDGHVMLETVALEKDYTGER